MTDSAKSLSDAESDETGGDAKKLVMMGVLMKWTNYIHGWQDRYFRCQDGTLSYYRSEDETEYGCRGSISLSKAAVCAHEFDPCRFDVCINDSTWYLRASEESERQQWIDVIEANRFYEDDDISTVSERSTSSLVTSHESLKEKILELETFRRILNKQINNLLGYMGACHNYVTGGLGGGDVGSPVDAGGPRNHLPPGASDVDFKGEAITFKATTTGIQATLSRCVELMRRNEEMWRRKCSSLEKRLEEAEAEIAKERKTIVTSPSPTRSSSCDEGMESDSGDDFRDASWEPEEEEERKHRFSDEVDRRIEEHLGGSLGEPDQEEGWELLSEDQEGMRLFRRELVRNGVVCDPFRATRRVRGITGRELCHFFWESTVRREWDSTLERIRVLEVFDDVTVMTHQVHKQVWPVAQRDCLYVSTMREIPDQPPFAPGGTPRNTWVVCNFSADHPEAHPDSTGCVRALVEIALLCQTYVTPASQGGAVTRDCVECDVIYAANVDPGGWAPASVLRAIGKREYPKFLRNFVNFVEGKVADSEPWF